MFRKEKLSLQKDLDLLQNLQSESRDALTDASSNEEIPANNLLEFSSDSTTKRMNKTHGAVVHAQLIKYFLPQDAVL
ncbi:hypothetical protein TNCV_4607371 [Trichonephila clavipes]|nr:hypothetical protein TNCV_4607371 [Trichonephila clavipes]